MKMISAERAVEILEEEGCSRKVIEHVKAVSEKSLEIAERISKNGHEVNLELVEVGGLLHDIGRCKVHDISHGIRGAEILRKRGLDQFACFAENHLGAGIDIDESENLAIPKGEYLPESLEEKIVTYGDNLVDGSEFISFEEAMDEMRRELGGGHPSLERFREIHRELSEFGGVED